VEVDEVGAAGCEQLRSGTEGEMMLYPAIVITDQPPGEQTARAYR
jgi:hypothetical protein